MLAMGRVLLGSCCYGGDRMVDGLVLSGLIRGLGLKRLVELRLTQRHADWAFAHGAKSSVGRTIPTWWCCTRCFSWRCRSRSGCCLAPFPCPSCSACSCWRWGARPCGGGASHPRSPLEQPGDRGAGPATHHRWAYRLPWLRHPSYVAVVAKASCCPWCTARGSLPSCSACSTHFCFGPAFRSKSRPSLACLARLCGRRRHRGLTASSERPAPRFAGRRASSAHGRRQQLCRSHALQDGSRLEAGALPERPGSAGRWCAYLGEKTHRSRLGRPVAPGCFRACPKPGAVPAKCLDLSTDGRPPRAQRLVQPIIAASGSSSSISSKLVDENSSGFRGAIPGP